MDPLSDLPDAFPCRDLGIAAFLLSQDVPLVDVQPLSQNHVVFLFAERNRCEALTRTFCAGRAIVNARGFLEAQRRARDLRDSTTLTVDRRNYESAPQHTPS